MTEVFANLFEPENQNPETPAPEKQKEETQLPPGMTRAIVTINGQRQEIYWCVCNGGCYPPCYDAPDGKCDQEADCPNNCYC